MTIATTYIAINAGIIEVNGTAIAGGTELGNLIVHFFCIHLLKIITAKNPIIIAVKYPRELIWFPGISPLIVTDNWLFAYDNPVILLIISAKWLSIPDNWNVCVIDVPNEIIKDASATKPPDNLSVS